MPIEVTDDLVPLKLPHFELRENKLYFLASPLPQAELDPPDLELWGHLDGATTVIELRRGWPDVPARLQRFWSLGLCEFAPERFPPGRRRILILEPHMDDAVFSVGGTIWARRAECEFTVATTASRSNYTLYWLRDTAFFEVERVTALRKAEAALAMRLVGGHHVALDEPDAPLRYQPGDWTLEWFRRHRQSVEAYRSHSVTEEEIAAWAATFERLLATADAQEVWLPLGVGDHADHERARDACLRALGPLPGMERRATVFFYEDIPHTLGFPGHAERIVAALNAAGGALVPEAVDIGPVMAGKRRLAAVFASQFDRNYIIPKIEQAARNASPQGTGFGELRFRAEEFPDPVEPMALYSGWPAVESIVRRLRRWYKRHSAAPRIRVLAPEAVGRWAEDLAYLLEAFPNATLEMHISEANAAETERLTSPRIEVRVVPAGGWVRRMARVARSLPCPTVSLDNSRGGMRATMVRAWASATGALSATKMDHFVRALRIVRSES